MSTVVIDSNVAAKTFSAEPDSAIGIAFLRACVADDIRILVPDIFGYEIAAIANKKDYPMEKVLGFFRDTMDALMDVRFPSEDAWLQASHICQHGHEKSGYPSTYDSVYHAMAILENGCFITADKRHYAKAKSFGHIALLEDWETALATL